MEGVVLCLKAPEPGKVLTGMQGLLQPQQCVELYSAFLEDAYEFTQELGLKRIFACSPNVSHPYFQELGKRFYIEMIDYVGQTPGERINNALRGATQKGCTKSLLWDAESPGYPARIFKEIFTRLEKSDLVLGPAMDYGTYIIGAKAKALNIFTSSKWDTHSEFVDLVNAAEKAKLSVYIHQVWNRLRKPEDLPFFVMNLKQILKTAPRTARNTVKVLTSFNLF